MYDPIRRDDAPMDEEHMAEKREHNTEGGDEEERDTHSKLWR